MTRMTDQIGRVLGGRYRLLSAVGSGASAHVYLADDVRLRRRVAVKVLHPGLADDGLFLRRFRAEARAAAALSHPHILAVFDWSGDEDAPYLVTEFLGGGSLRSMLDAGHRLTPAQTLVVGLETVRALDHAHRQGFVHRDIKPANLLFGTDARLRVADFGLARAIAEAGWTEPTGAMLGTARYASPEQARGESVDGASDVYSLALVLVEAVTGTVPFSADTTIGTLMGRLEHPLLVPEVMGPLTTILTEAGGLDAGARPDAAAFGAGLIAAAEQMARPSPLPLAPPSVNGAGAEDPRDSTLVRPEVYARGNGARSGEGGGASALVVASGMAISGPVVGAVGATGTAPNGLAGTSLESASDLAGTTTGAGPGAVDTASTTVLPPPPSLPPPPAGPPHTPPTGAPALSAGDRSARRLMLGAVVVAVAVAIGVVGSWLYIRSQVPSHAVPGELVGAQQDQAIELIGENGWNIVTERDYYDDTAEGEIVRTVPEPGTSLREGETLTLHVSLGPPLVAVPQDLVGLSQEDAEARLATAGLAADVQQQPSDEVDAGIVMALGEDVANQAPRGSSVALLVSSGPDEPEIPDLQGEQYQDAVAELEALGLHVELDFRRARGGHDEGEVIRTDPDEGERVDQGSTVVVVVAGGQVTVPNVEGATLDEARAELEDVGLNVGIVFDPEDGRVQETVPHIDTEVDPGTAIDLVMVSDE
jgi:beta-lactam-binding protein with PASTA domain/serine/threonine protein kinase